MNLDQMEFRCPDAEVIGNVMVKDYRLAFRGNSRGNGVASILPEQGEQVSGVLWSITEKCEKSLDYYEGFPISVAGKSGTAQEVKNRPDHGLFIGYAPADDPEIAVAVRIVNGYEAGNAVECGKNIFEYYFGIE